MTWLKAKKMGPWTEEHQQAFDAIKEKLSSAPVLAAPRFGESFIVETDAAKWAIAGCLLQKNEQGHAQPKAYMSKLLNKHQRN